MSSITLSSSPANVERTWRCRPARRRAGSKRHAKPDRSDARMFRELLPSGERPETWIQPTAVLERRERVRHYKSLVEHRRGERSGSTPSCSSTASPCPRGRSARRPRTTGCSATTWRDASRVGNGKVGIRCSRSPTSKHSHRSGICNASSRQLACRALVEEIVRHRRVDRGGGVVRARRWSSRRPVRAGGASQRPGRPAAPPTVTAPMAISPAGTGNGIQCLLPRAHVAPRFGVLSVTGGAQNAVRIEARPTPNCLVENGA